jgi:predicted nucleotidyltransferase
MYHIRGIRRIRVQATAGSDRFSEAGLPPMTQQEILRTIAQFRRSREDEFGIIRIGVFGSAAHEEINDESDVDVVVEIAEPDLLTMVGIKQELEELLQRPVDIVRYRENMNDFLKQRIDRDAVYV